MHKNILWQAFLLVTLLIVIGYSTVAFYKYYVYSRLSSETKSSEIQWTVQEKAEDKFQIEAHYFFLVNGKKEEGKAVLPEAYRNRWAAEQDIALYSKKKWTVWYSPSSPQYSALQKNFPYKECLSALVLWGLLLYFFFLGYYVGRYKE